ncbi:MAG: PqqD family protein [Lentisphaerae bacterium]|nr:PqqD family protein [Lentisphaerota bacterium]
MSTIEPSTIIRRNEEVLFGEIDDEIVMMSVEKGCYYSLDLSATRIWELLEEPTTLSSLCDQLVKEYEIDPETCGHDVLAFLDKLKEQEIILTSAAAG